MKAARAVLISLAVCLSCTVSLSGDFESTGEVGKSGSRETFASHLQKSVDYYAAGDFERSLQAAEDALRLLDEQSAVAYNNICSAQMRLGAYQQAALACNKALELWPGYERARDNLAWVYERIVEQTPTVGAYLNLSVVRYWQGELGESVAAAQQALELDPNNSDARANIAIVYFNLKDYDKTWDQIRVLQRMGYRLNPVMMDSLRKVSGIQK